MQSLSRDPKIDRTLKHSLKDASAFAVMTGIGEWLGVDPDGFPTSDIRATSVGNYRDGLTDEELDTVNTIAGGTLTKLGYS